MMGGLHHPLLFLKLVQQSFVISYYLLTTAMKESSDFFSSEETRTVYENNFDIVLPAGR